MSRPSAPVSPRKKSRALGFGLSLVDPRAWLQLFRLVHYYNYNHVRPRRAADIGPGVRMAPNVSLRNGERIKIGAYARIGSHCSLWAGDSVGGSRSDATLCWGLKSSSPRRTMRPSRARRSWTSPSASATWSSATTSGLARGLWWSQASRSGRLHRRRKLGGHAVDSAGSIAARNSGPNCRPEGRPESRVGGSGSRSPLGGLCRQVTSGSPAGAPVKNAYIRGGEVNDGT